LFCYKYPFPQVFATSNRDFFENFSGCKTQFAIFLKIFQNLHGMTFENPYKKLILIYLT